MLKNLQNTLVVLIMMLVLMSTACLATDAQSQESNAEITSTTESTTTGEEANVPADESNGDSVGEEGDTADNPQEPEMILKDLFLIDQTVNHSTIVDGNAFIMGDDITISAPIGGDLFVLGNKVTITKDCIIYGNLYLMANDANLDCYVYGGNLYAACSTLTVGENGAVYRDMSSISSKLDFNGAVGRTVSVTANEITLGEKVKMYGDFNYSSPSAIQVPSDAVNGKINYKELEESEEEETNPVVNYVMDLVYSLVYTVVLFFLILLFAPKFINKLENVTTNKIGPSLLKGLAVLFITPLVSIALFITIIGIPVGLVLLALWILLVFAFSTTLSVIAIAGLVAKKVQVLAKVHNLPAVVVVALAVWLIGLIPFVGGILYLLLCIYGLGLLFADVFSKKEKTENKAEENPVQE